MSTENNEAKTINQVMGMFNRKPSQVKLEAEEVGGNKFFSPKATETTRTDGVRPIEFRLLTNIEDYDHPITSKRGHKFVADGRTMYIDAPAKKAKGYTIVTSTSYRWFKSDDARLNELAKEIIYTGEKNICLIQVVSDKSGTYQAGEIFPMALPKDVLDFIKAKKEPSKEDIADGAKPVDFFDPMNGVNIKAKLKNDPYSDLNDGGKMKDANKWFELEITQPIGMLIKNKEGELKNVKIEDSYTDEQKMAIYGAVEKMYTESGVKLSDYAFKPLDEETEKKVKQAFFIMEAAVVGAENVHSDLRLDADTEKSLTASVTAATTAEATLTNDQSEAVNSITGDFEQAFEETGTAKVETVEEETTEETDDLPF